MRDIRHCLGKYPFLGRNERPGPFFRFGHLLHFTMQRYSPIVPKRDTNNKTAITEQRMTFADVSNGDSACATNIELLFC